MELAHIEPKAENAPNTFENCIPVCFDCHADIGHYNNDHPRGKKYTASELQRHRDSWYAKVKSSGGPTATEAHLVLDRKLFSQISGVLPVNGSMAFVQQLNVEVPFCFGRLADLREFYWFCQRPDVEFMDADLETLLIALVSFSDEFVSLLAANTFPIKGSKEDLNELSEEWRYKNPKSFMEMLYQILDTRTKLLESFAAFVGGGRRKLGIDYVAEPK